MQIRFCFEIEDFNSNIYDFAVNRPSDISFIEMTGNSTLNDINLFIASLLSFNELSLDSKFLDSLFIKDELALSRFIFKKDNISIRPSCCADFQDWTGVIQAIKTKKSYWMGHDPNPWFEFKDEEIILWSDEKAINNTVYSIQFTQQKFEQQLIEAKQELYSFWELVKQWSEENYVANSKNFSLGIKHYLLI